MEFWNLNYNSNFISTQYPTIFSAANFIIWILNDNKNTGVFQGSVSNLQRKECI